jgi:hypothetical protein
MPTCTATSPCTSSITCDKGCACQADIRKIDGKPDECVRSECICQGFTFTEIASKSKSMGIQLNSFVLLDIKQLSMETLARFLSYHAPSVDLYIPARLIEEVVDFHSTESELFKDIIKKLGLRIADEEVLVST